MLVSLFICLVYIYCVPTMHQALFSVLGIQQKIKQSYGTHGVYKSEKENPVLMEFTFQREEIDKKPNK